MESASSAAARALARGDGIEALKWIGARRDPIARGMKATAYAQMGELPRARKLIRSALREKDVLGAPLTLARCLAVDTEIALAIGDTRWDSARVERAVDALERAGDIHNAMYLRVVAARAAVRLRMYEVATRFLSSARFENLAPTTQVILALLRAEAAYGARDAQTLQARLDDATHVGKLAGLVTLLAEIDDMRTRFARPVARHAGREVSRDTLWRLTNPALVEKRTLVLDGTARRLISQANLRDFSRKPVLFSLLAALAAASPHDVPRDKLIETTFYARRPNASHRARLRVELGRLRAALKNMASIEATRDGYALRTSAQLIVLTPIDPSAENELHALLDDGAAWSASNLAAALRTSERSVQRALRQLERDDRVAQIGSGRACRWVRKNEIPTDLLLPRLTRTH